MAPAGTTCQVSENAPPTGYAKDTATPTLTFGTPAGNVAFSDTRTTGKIELAKVWSGAAGNATLRIGTTAGGTEIATGTANGVNGTTGEQTVPTRRVLHVGDR